MTPPLLQPPLLQPPLVLPLAEAPAPRRPARLLVAGEFSAGKTQLINGLLGQAILPSNVTATEMPAVWLTRLPVATTRIDNAGVAHPLPDLSAIAVADTAFCLMSHGAPFLDGIDLIDTPGNSDPNMPVEAWQRMLCHADAVVWCSSAVQAWRQSEKSAWQEMPPALRDNAVLLLTHADRLGDAQNRDKVLRRVQREAAQHFAHILMVSLVCPEDLERVAACLRGLARALPVLAGRDHATVSAALAASVPLPADPPAPTAQDRDAQRQARQARRLARRLRHEARLQRARPAAQDPARRIWLELAGPGAGIAPLPSPLDALLERYFDRINQELTRTAPQDRAPAADI